jgi:hypothetical protein
MKKLIILIVSIHCSLFTAHLYSQSCLPEGIIFTTQAQIDSFQLNYPGCTEIEGSVEIYGDDITNLLGLTPIISIEGNLQIGYLQYMASYGANPRLLSMEGLHNIKSVDGSVIILGNDSLVDLSGLESLVSIGGDLRIGDFWHGMYLTLNPLLSSLNGLNPMINISGSIQIAGSPISSLTELSNLTSVSGSLGIWHDTLLTSLYGLHNITYVGGSLSLVDLCLSDLSRLENLDSINGSLMILKNRSLKSLTSLENISPGTIKDLSILSNDSLTSCSVRSICEYLVSPNGYVNIGYNAPGCNSQEEVEENCDSIPCLPDGIVFHTQGQIDSFPANYPNCNEIEGGVTISGNDIYNLDSLYGITKIEGYLLLRDNENLTSLSGLDNLFSVGELILGSYWVHDITGAIVPHGNPKLTDLSALGNLPPEKQGIYLAFNTSLSDLTGLDNTSSVGNLQIVGNDALINLDAFSNLDSIFGDLRIGIWPYAGSYSSFTYRGNLNLVDISGLNSLKYIGDCLGIIGNSKLKDLSGINNLKSIGGYMHISGNGLSSFTGIENLTSIGGNLIIVNNDSLTSLGGLNSIESGSIGDLCIKYNNTLSVCEAQSICDYLSAPGGSVDIFFNAPGCNSPGEIADACGINICLPYGNYYFHSQNDIDTFQLLYPDCVDLGGTVKIGCHQENDITNLNGLNEIKSVEGDLWIFEAGGLTSFSGLDNLVQIGGDLVIGMNDQVSDLSGLGSLTEIGGTMSINLDSLEDFSGLNNLLHIGEDFVAIGFENLVNFTGLENLNMINGNIFISENNSLASLSGLDNIKSESSPVIYIHGNPQLSICNIQSVCNFVANPNATVVIYDNAIGCSSPEEVEAGCDTLSISERNYIKGIMATPNPFTTSTTLTYTLDRPQNVHFTLYNLQSKIVYEMQEKQDKGEQRIEWNAEGLPAGMYYYRIQAGDKVGGGKMVKMD